MNNNTIEGNTMKHIPVSRTRRAGKIVQMALFMIWLIMLTPIYTASALVIEFNPQTDVVVTDRTATVTWRTDEETTGKINYGPVGKINNDKSSEMTGLEHEVRLTGLASDFTFDFFIEARNNTAVARSPDTPGTYHQFTTDAPYDRIPPHAVKELQAVEITRDSTKLIWQADERDEDIEKFEVLRDSISIINLTGTEYQDTGLSYETEYAYQVRAWDIAGNPGPLSPMKVTTKDENYRPMQITGLEAEAIGNNIYVSWTTSIPGYTRVNYGYTEELLDMKEETAETVTSHNVTLRDLNENINVTLRVLSCGEEDNCATSAKITVQTAEKIELSLDLDGLDCNPSTATYSKSTRFDIKGTSSPGAEVNLYVNDKRARFKKITSTSEFVFAGVSLDPDVAENRIRVVASDKISMDKVCEDKILLDFNDPEVEFSNETLNTTLVTQTSFRFSGTIFDDTGVTLNAYLKSQDDIEGPPAPENITDTEVTDRKVSISWEPFPPEVDDVFKYVIYRSDVPDGPIAAVDSNVYHFSDLAVSSGTTYTYQVRAIDQAGNDGTLSSYYSVTTEEGDFVAEPTLPIEKPSSALVLTKKYTPNGNPIDFTETVSGLFQGNNKIELEYTDKAGNTVSRTFDIVYDGEPPRIITPSSAELSSLYSPTYMTNLLLTGQINKNAGEVWVFVNNDGSEPDYKVEVASDGTFEADIELSENPFFDYQKFGELKPEEGKVEMGGEAQGGIDIVTGASKNNNIRLIAVDPYGRKSDAVQGAIEYSPCSENYLWQVTLKDGGSQLNSRELIEGIAVYGFGFDLHWIGGGDASKARAVRVTAPTASVGPREAKKYDSDWLAGEPRVLCKNPTNCTEGFILMNFLPVNAAGDTVLEKEKNISNHREGECWPEFGCIHLLLELTVESDPAALIGQYGPEGPPPGTTPMGTQKQCIDTKIFLDPRFDFAASEFVKSILTGSIAAINATLGVIDLIEEPIRYASQITALLCVASVFGKLALSWYKSLQCKWSAAITALAKKKVRLNDLKAGIIERVATMHNSKDVNEAACNVEFNPNNEDSKDMNSVCVDCADAVQKMKEWENRFNFMCDRVMCPSVPSLQHYILSKWTQGRPDHWMPEMTTVKTVTTEDYTKYEQYKKQGLWKSTSFKSSPSDCAFAQTTSSALQAMYKASKNSELAAKCGEGHLPQPACCVFEYMDKWEWGMLFSDEVEKSYCLSNPEDKTVCGLGETITNGITGLCQPNGPKPNAKYVVLDGLKWNQNFISRQQGKLIKPYNAVFLLDFDDKGTVISAKLGYFVEGRVRDIGEVLPDGSVDINTGSAFVPAYPNEDGSSWFAEMNNKDLSLEKDKEHKGLAAFKNFIDKHLNSDFTYRTKSKSAKVDDSEYKKWYQQITGLIGNPGQQYIAQPAGSFIQSVITVCISGISAWLTQFKNILTMLKQCFQTIIVTGDGEAGQCRNLISQYTCDVLKEAISCGVQRFGGKASARIDFGGIGGWFSAAADASAQVTAMANERYGDRNLISTTFAAENLAYDACMLMFTGEWPTDFLAAFKGAAELPINSTVLINPGASRSWRAYNPATNYAAYVYKFGYSVFAGSDIQFNINLVCSNGACPDGKDGICDCGHGDPTLYTGKPTVRTIKRHGSGNCPESGQLKKGEYCTDEVIFLLEGMPYRYDKIKIDYYTTQQTGGKYGGSSTSPGTGSGTGGGGVMSTAGALLGSAEQQIIELGKPTPGLCSFSMSTFDFRCGYTLPASGTAKILSYELTKPVTKSFGIGDSQIASVKINQALPKDPPSCAGDCEFTKYLVIKEIRNQNNALIYPLKGKNVVGERLNEERIWNINLFDEDFFKQHSAENDGKLFKISEDMFYKQSSGTCIRSTDIHKGDKEITLAEISAPDCSDLALSGKTPIRIIYQNQKFSYVFGSITDNKYQFSDQNIKDCLYTNSASDPVVTCGDMKFTAKKTFILNAEKNKRYEFGMLYNPPAEQAPLTECKTKPQEWKAIIELRDAVSTGNGAGYQMAQSPLMNSETNKPETLEIKFKVLCTDAEDTDLPKTGGLDDLKGSAILKAENTQSNSLYGMWVDDNHLGPTEDIVVSGFNFIEESGTKTGFKFAVNSRAEYAILNIDLKKIPVDHSSYLVSYLVKKEGAEVLDAEVLDVCSSSVNPPCLVKRTKESDLAIKLSPGMTNFMFELGIDLSQQSDGAEPVEKENQQGVEEDELLPSLVPIQQ